MRDRLAQIVFRVDARAYRVGDALLLAALRGEWPAFEREVRAGVACAHRAEREGDPVSPEALAEAEEEFRYERDLIAAEEMEAWLRERGLEPEAWSEALHRGLLREHWMAVREDVVSHDPSSADELAAAWWPDAVVGGFLERQVGALAGRVALGAEAAPAAAAAAELPDWLGPCEADAERVANLAALEAGFQRARDQAVEPAAVSGCIAAHALDWTRLAIQYGVFAEEPAAREALLRLREDGDDFRDVARDAGLPLVEEDDLLAELPPEIAGALLSAAAGEIVGPVKTEEGFAVVATLARTVPTPDDAGLCRRAGAELWEREVERCIQDRLVWEVEP